MFLTLNPFLKKVIWKLSKSDGTFCIILTFSAVSTSETTSSVEQERYLSVLVCATPLSALRQGSAWHMSDSTLSIDSLLLAAEDHVQGSGTLTPEVSRRANPFNKAMGTLR